MQQYYVPINLLVYMDFHTLYKIDSDMTRLNYANT